MITTGLRRLAILSEVTSGHILSFNFLIDRFGSSRSYTAFQNGFPISEEIWRAARVDALMMCVISYLYMPIYLDHLDVGVVMVQVRALHDDHTILPLILAETYIFVSYCHVTESFVIALYCYTFGL